MQGIASSRGGTSLGQGTSCVAHSFSSLASKDIDLREFGGRTNWELEAEVRVEAGWKERQEEVI